MRLFATVGRMRRRGVTFRIDSRLCNDGCESQTLLGSHFVSFGDACQHSVLRHAVTRPRDADKRASILMTLAITPKVPAAREFLTRRGPGHIHSFDVLSI